VRKGERDFLIAPGFLYDAMKESHDREKRAVESRTTRGPNQQGRGKEFLSRDPGRVATSGLSLCLSICQRAVTLREMLG